MSSIESPAQPKPLRIAIITRDPFHAGETPELAACLSGQIEAIASDGDPVTVIVVPHPQVPSSEADGALLEAAARLGGAGVQVRPLRVSPHISPPYDSDEKAALGIYHDLREEDYDVAYFGLPGGLAYYTLLARETGCKTAPGSVFVLALEPMLWRSEADRFFLKNLEEIGIAFRERYCLEHADGVICASGAMKRWMEAMGWNLPAATQVLPTPLASERAKRAEGCRQSRRWPIGEIVFAGGPGFRGGLTLFCDAMDALVLRSDARLTVTMLGEFGRVLGEHTGGMLLRRARRWPYKVLMLPTLSADEQMDYLRDRGGLAVLPALDASLPLTVSTLLESGLPFVATRVGGIPELVASEDHERCLCEPGAEALAARIKELVGQVGEPARPATSREEALSAWRAHLDAVRSSKGSVQRREYAVGDAPRVSVVLVHHDRPDLLMQAVRSLERQSYGNFEVILVDDGSATPEAKAALEGLDDMFNERGWSILREPNRHLGAARNAGVRASKGEYVIFLDDDNVLFNHAIEDLVRAIRASGSDICTCLCKLLHTKDAPEAGIGAGQIHYFPLGGSPDLAMFHNSIGDANAIIRRTVFERIGYLIEDYGYACHDWEFFTRALLEGLKVSLVPEALFWYRQDGQGMYRQSHWYNNRQPIVRLLQRYHFKGLDYFHHLALASHVGALDQESLHHNLRFNASDHPYLRLRPMEPQSGRAIRELAKIAEGEGRAETAASLIRQGRISLEEEIAERIAMIRAVATPEDAKAAALEAGLEASASLRGFVEDIAQLPGGTCRIVGWIADLRPDGPAPRVALFQDGELLGVGRPSVVRPDLASGFEAPHLQETGAQFTLTIRTPSHDGGGIVAIVLNSLEQFAVIRAAAPHPENA